jgi:hypothetical protein
MKSKLLWMKPLYFAVAQIALCAHVFAAPPNIVVLVADPEPLVWGSQELKDGASLVGKRWIDISSIAADPVWAPAAAALDAAPTPELHQQLKEKIENDILDLLEDHNCHPSLSLEASCLTTTAPTPFY